MKVVRLKGAVLGEGLVELAKQCKAVNVPRGEAEPMNDDVDELTDLRRLLHRERAIFIGGTDLNREVFRGARGCVRRLVLVHGWNLLGLKDSRSRISVLYTRCNVVMKQQVG